MQTGPCPGYAGPQRRAELANSGPECHLALIGHHAACQLAAVLRLSFFGICLLVGPSLLSETTNSFLEPVLVNKSTGHMLVENCATSDGSVRNTATLYSWSNGNYVAESGRLTTNGSILQLTNVFEFSGKWFGTNWEHRSGQLVLHYKPGPQLSELLDALQGRFPCEHAFLQIIGRGLSYDDFMTIEHTNSKYVGLWFGKIPFELKMRGQREANAFDFTITLKGEDKLRFDYSVEVQRFSPDQYLTTYVRHSIVEAGETNEVLHKRIVEFGPNLGHRSLSPFDLFGRGRLLEVDSGLTYLVTNGVRKELKPLDSVVNKNVPKNGKRLVVLAVLAVTSLVGGSLLLSMRNKH